MPGFLTLGLEVLWTRMFSQVLQNSVYTFAAILTVFLIALGVGSGLANLLCRARWSPPLVIFLLLTLSGVTVGLTPIVFYRLTSGLEMVALGQGWNEYILSVFLRTGMVLFLPVLLMGSVFPYLMKVRERGMTSAGKTIGELVFVNTVAAILGSLVAGFLFLETMGLWKSLRAMTLLYLLLAFLTLSGMSRARLLLRGAPLVAMLIFASVITYADFADVHLDRSKNEELLQTWEGPHGTVTVVRSEDNLRIKVNNSYSLGSSQASLNQLLQAWVPLSLHPQPRSVFFLGMGTGITAGGALDFPVEKVTVCELNPDVVAASRAHFQPYLNGLFEDPRVEVLAEDGRNYLQGTDRRYDVIISDLFLTYRAGVGSFYTKEHFEAVRERLAPGGFFAQWALCVSLRRGIRNHRQDPVGGLSPGHPLAEEPFTPCPHFRGHRSERGSPSGS